MKRYFYLLFAFVAVLTSCSNDDITISSTTSFRINPSTVIAPFTWEWEAGDLESFDTDYQLRIRLLIYDMDGILVTEDTQYFSNYSVLMTSALDLTPGAYTAVAITDLVGRSASAVEEYWTLSDHQRLADTHIDDAGYIGGKNKILGISNRSITISNDTQNEFTIDVHPVGSIFFVWYRNIHTFDFVNRYTLVCSKTAESCVFDSNGSFSIVAENNNGSYDWRISYVDPASYEDAAGVYDYFYVLPVTNLNLKFEYDTSSSERNDLTDVMTINPQAGEEWAFILDLQNEENGGGITYEFGILNGANSRNIVSMPQGSPSLATLGRIDNQNQSIYLKDINQ